jgi:glucose/arabinose dehydrogenase
MNYFVHSLLSRYAEVIYFVCILVIASYACNNSAFAAPSIKDTNLQINTVATGLSKPTSMAFLGPNDILVLEKDTGLVKRIKNGVILSAPLLDVNVATSSERGMLGIDVKRRGSSTTQFDVYLYYTLASNGGDAHCQQIVQICSSHRPKAWPCTGANDRCFNASQFACYTWP